MRIFAAALILAAVTAAAARAEISKFNPPDLYNASQFSHVVTSRHIAKVVFISAQVGRRADGSLASSTRLKTQLRQLLDNLAAALKTAGATPADVVRVHVYVPQYAVGQGIVIAGEMRYFFNFEMPTSTFVPIAALPDHETMVAIDAVAEIPANSP